MIDRGPNLDAARAAAIELDADLAADLAQHPTVDEVERAEATIERASSAIAASRAQLVKFGSLLVLNLSTKAATRWGAHWIYSEGECIAVATAALDVADLYLDELDGPWTNLAIVLAATAIPRMLGEKLPPLVEPTSTATSERAAA